MERVINIGGQSVAMKATASTLRRYRAQFGRDLLEDFQTIQQAMGFSEADPGTVLPAAGAVLDLVADLAYIMARQADPSVPVNPEDWLDRFDVFPVDVFASDVVLLWAESMGMLSEEEEDTKNG